MAKSETPFNFRLNNHRSEVSIPWKCNPHMPLYKQRFKKHAKLTLIESTTNTNKTKEALQKRRKDDEIFGLELQKFYNRIN